jgi:mRNA-degrading endonuclease RelE of RelBE toxin-antitoxin system
VTWQVFVRAAAESDLDRLTKDEQNVVTSAMFDWVENGPPRQTPRDVLGVEMFDDRVSGGFRITYVVEDLNERILVVRIRRGTSTAEPNG